MPRKGERKPVAIERDYVSVHNRFSESTVELLRLHSYLRRVSATVLVRDIVEAWIAFNTDYDDGYFNPARHGIDKVVMPPERYPGYLETLGFAESEGESDHMSGATRT